MTQQGKAPRVVGKNPARVCNLRADPGIEIRDKTVFRGGPTDWPVQ